MEGRQRAAAGVHTKIVAEPSGEAVAEHASRTGGVAERSAAFRRLANEYLLDAYKLANAILANPAEAEDAVHDAFVRAWDKWASLRDPHKFEPWFKRIVVNTCRNRLKRRSRQTTVEIAAHAGLSTPDAWARS